MNDIILSFGLDPQDFSIRRIGTGYINDTYKLTGRASYVLQRINKNIFTQPETIATNIRTAAGYLRQHHPEYLFLAPAQTVRQAEMSYDQEGYPWRLYHFIDHSITIDRVVSEKEAFSAAAEFGRLTCYLDGIQINLFKPTIPRFHDLSWRHEQFQQALKSAAPERLRDAADVISSCNYHQGLVNKYDQLIRSGSLKLRITHNDTKINNILIHEVTREAMGVIDLDTLMPGYFIYDVGDMIRTFVPPVDEEEKDLDAIEFRQPIYDALKAGYLSSMGKHLTEVEQTLFPFAGMMMTYIMALRMATDYLQGDVYYQTTYPRQNYSRAKNQLRLLDVLSAISY